MSELRSCRSSSSNHRREEDHAIVTADNPTPRRRSSTHYMLAALSLTPSASAARPLLRRRGSDVTTITSSSSRLLRQDNHDNDTPSREVPHQLLSCPPQYTGPYPTPTCAHYYHCDGGEAADNLIYECGEGLLFSLRKGICDWKDQVRCAKQLGRR